MPGSTFGKLFCVTTWGESHGPAIGAVIDGCPPQIPLNESIIQEMLDKRRPGRAKTSTPRREPDHAKIMSGVFEGKTTGTPIMIMIENKDARSDAYSTFSTIYRPGHGDITYDRKYGIRDWRGGGRASARETAGRVAAGAVAKALLHSHNIQTIAYTKALGTVTCEQINMAEMDSNPYCAPNKAAAKAMEKHVEAIKKIGDSIGGIVEVRITNIPAGLGDPVFDKLDADLAKAMMSIGAVKGVEIGAGFAAAQMKGSENNDPITPSGFATNNAGGILAGISTGQDILLRVAVKPIPSIAIPQQTIDATGQSQSISISGRHDISAIPRINVVCEAMANLVIADHLLRQKAISTTNR